MFIRLTLLLVITILLSSQSVFCQPSETPSPPNGESIFASRCAKCHGEKGEGVSAVVTIAGPSLQAEHDHGQVMMAMEVGPSHMPQFPYLLSVKQMRAVADYVTQKLAVIPLAGGNVSEGGTLFRVNCAPCHRTAVRGGALAFTGVNAPELTGKSAAIVAAAIRWGPGPMPRFPASFINDQQLDSIVEYVKFVQRPPRPGGNALHYYGPVAEGFVAWIVVFALIMTAGWIERGGKG